MRLISAHIHVVNFLGLALVIHCDDRIIIGFLFSCKTLEHLTFLYPQDSGRRTSDSLVWQNGG